MTDDSVEKVVADPRWSIYMKARIPECADVCDDVVRMAGRERSAVDVHNLGRVVADAAWQRLRELTIARRDVEWHVLAELRDAHRGTLADFLSTKGAVGIAVHDKLSSYLLFTLPLELAERVASGEFDWSAGGTE